MRIAPIEEAEDGKEENINDCIVNEQTLKQYASFPLSKMDINNIASVAFVWEHQGLSLIHIYRIQTAILSFLG